MMRITMIFILSLLALGCISLDDRGNVTNVTENVTFDNVSDEVDQNLSEPPRWVRYYAPSFSFEHPVKMETQQAAGIFSGTQELNGQTAEILVVVYLDTAAIYGENQDDIFKANPTKAASDFLLEDQEDDPAQILDDAEEIGDMSTFTIVRDAYVAEVPFKIRFSETGPRYTGHAMDLYLPERSLHVKFRVLALEPEVAKQIRDQFLLTFRLE